MTRNQVLRSVLLATGVLMIAACASQPASKPADDSGTSAPAGSALLEKKFQRVARQYQKYEHEGQLVYCKRGATRSLPPTECIYATALRKQVEEHEQFRNPVQRGGPQYVATVPGGSGQ